MPSIEPLAESWGARVRSRRTARGMSLRRLSVLTDMDGSHLSTMERGRSGVSDRNKLRIAAALGTTVADLFPFPSTVAETAELAGIAPPASERAA